jgi:hypothetical protein
MKITKRKLIRLIKESLLHEADTGVHQGDHDPIRLEIPALEQFATEENFDGKKIWFSDSDASSIAYALEDGEPNRELFDWTEKGEKEYDDAKKKYDDIGRIFSFDEDAMRELATNIHDAIKKAKDLGYEY